MSAPGGDRATPVEELAEVARRIARLLSQPRYDEAELAELDVRANALRARVREDDARRRELGDCLEMGRPGGVRLAANQGCGR